MSEEENYVAVLRRAIPVEGCAVDTSTCVIRDGETVRDVMNWAKKVCSGSAVLISVEITKAQPLTQPEESR
jgi:urease gamma subunit